MMRFQRIFYFVFFLQFMLTYVYTLAIMKFGGEKIDKSAKKKRNFEDAFKQSNGA